MTWRFTMLVDISRAQLTQSAALFHKLFAKLEIFPVCADYLQPFRASDIDTASFAQGGLLSRLHHR